MAPLPADLMDRRVEITGPTDRKMVRGRVPHADSTCACIFGRATLALLCLPCTLQPAYPHDQSTISTTLAYTVAAVCMTARAHSVV